MRGPSIRVRMGHEVPEGGRSHHQRVAHSEPVGGMLRLNCVSFEGYLRAR